MTIQVPESVEEQLRVLAMRQGREVGLVVEDAIRLYLETTAITDLGSDDVAETQAALLSELPTLPDWKVGDA